MYCRLVSSLTSLEITLSMNLNNHRPRCLVLFIIYSLMLLTQQFIFPKYSFLSSYICTTLDRFSVHNIKNITDNFFMNNYISLISTLNISVGPFSVCLNGKALSETKHSKQRSTYLHLMQDLKLR